MSNILIVIFTVAFLLAIVEIGLIFSSRKNNLKKKKSIDIVGLTQKINQLLVSDDLNLNKQALIEADKLLDNVLKQLINGKDMGERLKNAKSIMADDNLYHLVWEAHKLRNKVVHEVDYIIDRKEIRNAVNNLKRAWKSIV